VFAAPRDDPLRERGADSRQPCDFAHIGSIEVDPLAGEEGAGKLRGAARRFAKARRTRGGLELDVTGGGGRRRREKMADAGTYQCKDG
jgi:hypothetical protein